MAKTKTKTDKIRRKQTNTSHFTFFLTPLNLGLRWNICYMAYLLLLCGARHRAMLLFGNRRHRRIRIGTNAFMGTADKKWDKWMSTKNFQRIDDYGHMDSALALYLLMKRAGWPDSTTEERIMDETTFQNKLTELMGEISSLPPSERARLETLAKETQERHQQLKKSINSLQDSLDWLRLSVKYMVFDLEATRRENQYLRQMLESSSEEGSL